MSAVCLSLQNVGKTFFSTFNFGPGRCRTLFDNISLEIKKGRTFGIIGSSGVGKTTLGRIMVGLESPTSGRVIFGGRDIAGMTGTGNRHYRCKFQMLFQDPEGSLNPRLSIERSLLDVLKVIKYPSHLRESLLKWSLEEVGLNTEILNQYPHQLSGGMNQRVALARLLILEPELIVLDEPTSALDLTVQAQVLHLLKELQQSKDLSYVLISHDMDIIRFMCDEAAILENGRLIPYL